MHTLEKKKKSGFMSFIKGDPLLKPFFGKEEENEEYQPEEKKSSAVDGLGVDI